MANLPFKLGNLGHPESVTICRNIVMSIYCLNVNIVSQRIMPYFSLRTYFRWYCIAQHEMIILTHRKSTPKS